MSWYIIGFVLVEASATVIFKYLINLGLHPYFLILTTGTLASALIGGVYWKKDSFKKTVLKKNSIRMSFLPALAITLGNLVGFVSLRLTTATNYTLISRLSVLMTPILAWFILKEKINHKIWPLIFLSMIGFWLLTGDWQKVFYLSGDSLAVITALLLSFDFIFQKKALNIIPLEVVAFWRRLISAVMVGSIWLVTPQLGRASINDIGWILLLTMCFYLLSIFMSKAIKSQPVADFNLFISLSPVFVVIIAYLVLQEKLNGIQLIGSGLILMALVGYNLFNRYDTRNNSGKIRIKVS
jgi:drug/metabolite transporter (DMT)-like permease